MRIEIPYNRETRTLSKPSVGSIDISELEDGEPVVLDFASDDIHEYELQSTRTSRVSDEDVLEVFCVFDKEHIIQFEEFSTSVVIPEDLLGKAYIDIQLKFQIGDERFYSLNIVDIDIEHGVSL